MPSSLVPPRHPSCGMVATTGSGIDVGISPSHSSCGGGGPMMNRAPTVVFAESVNEQG